MAVFFTSDTYFGHAWARSLYRRPFASVAAMDAVMLDRWNATVGPEDEVWHLGDFALGLPETAMAELLGRLHGRKHLSPATTIRRPRLVCLAGPASDPMPRSKAPASAWCSATTPSARGAT